MKHRIDICSFVCNNNHLTFNISYWIHFDGRLTFRIYNNVTVTFGVACAVRGVLMPSVTLMYCELKETRQFLCVPVCPYVCTCACISQKPLGQTPPNFDRKPVWLGAPFYVMYFRFCGWRRFPITGAHGRRGGTAAALLQCSVHLNITAAWYRLRPVLDDGGAGAKTRGVPRARGTGVNSAIYNWRDHV